jgi:hypothetical protein
LQFVRQYDKIAINKGEDFVEMLYTMHDKQLTLRTLVHKIEIKGIFIEGGIGNETHKCKKSSTFAAPFGCPDGGSGNALPAF